MTDHNEHPDMTNMPYNWLSDFVYGGIDGAVTTFAVVAGVEGASLSIPIILILGFANLFADGFSMSVGKYMSDKAAREQYQKIQQVEFQHLVERTEGEISEVREILIKYGFKGKKLKDAIGVITSNPDAWVDMMMRHEFNMPQENINPLKGALATFIAFFLVGLVPLITYIFKPILPFAHTGLFVITCITTFLALFAVGAIKSRFVLRNWFWSGLETALIGGAAATIAYLVGYFLKYLII